MRTLSDIDVSGKRVFVRGDLDIPISNFKFQISNWENQETSTRLANLKPTVDWLLGHGARQIIIAGHINRPEKPDPALSTKQLVEPLQQILRREIVFQEDVILRPKVEESQNRSFVRQSRTQDDRVMLLENLRFWPGEVANDGEFAKKLAALADIYVNEAFGNCHRVHASMVSLPKLLPHVAGLHLEQEVKVLSDVLENPKRPFVAIVGGVKIETKVPVIENLAKVADFVLVGGEIAKELKVESGKWKVDENKVIVATLTPDTKDIDEESIEKFKSVIASAKTIVWNGPMGMFEKGFEKGTVAVAEAIIQSDAYSVVGGGETTQFLGRLGMLGPPAHSGLSSSGLKTGGFSFVSSGGGAMLEFLAGKELPGIKALE